MQVIYYFYFLSKIERCVHYAKQNQGKTPPFGGKKIKQLPQILCKIKQKMHYFNHYFNFSAVNAIIPK